jgi:hypothetical protein
LDRKTPDYGDGRAGQQEDEILAAHHQHEAPPHQAPLLKSGPCGSALEPEQFGPNLAFHEVSDRIRIWSCRLKHVIGIEQRSIV